MSKPSRCTAAIAIFLICFFAPFVRSSPEGKIYQWTDPSGIKHFSNIAHRATAIPVQIFREKEPSTDKIDNSDQTPALLKNSTRGTKTVTNSPTSGKIEVRSAQTSRDLRAEGMNFIAKH